MTSIYSANFFTKLSKINFKQKFDVQKENLSIKNEKRSDIVEIRTRKNESFKEVFEEMRAELPDRTTTIEEKNIAINYINRMLACDDIPDDLKQYWQNKKEVIEMEIQNIKNEQKNKVGGETVKEVWREFSVFVNKYFELNDNLSMDEKFENRMAYYSTYLSFCQRFLACTDVTEEQRIEYHQMMNNAHRDIANWEADYNRYKDN